MDKGWLHQKGGRPNMQDILRCALEIGGALRYLHSRGILHGDLTGSNVLLCSCARDSRRWICKVSAQHQTILQNFSLRFAGILLVLAVLTA